MTRRATLVAMLAVSCACTCAHPHRPPATVVPVPGTGEARVLAARAHFNAQIVARDTAGLAGLFLPTYVLVTGRSAQTRGAGAAVEGWATIFRTDPVATYVRTPRDVRVNEAWGIAEELGDWTGRLSVAGAPLRVAGRYAAKWQRGRDGRWRLQAEVYTTFSCEGGRSACEALAPADQ